MGRGTGRNILSILLGILLIVSAPVASAALEPDVSSEAQGVYDQIMLQGKTKLGLDFIRNDHVQTVNDQKTITAIPAPPFKEKVRGDYYLSRLQAMGLKDVKMDSEGNVCGWRPGTGKGPALLVEAHLDTVFPAGMNTVPVEKDGKLFAPGIADDSRGLAAVLSVLRALKATEIKTVSDVLFCGTVGEEGLGDLRGMKALFRDRPELAGSINVDGISPSRITYLATGSHRYEVNFKGPGGHSFGAFGLPSAIHAMGRAIAKIAEVETPRQPRTTYTVGVVSGGTSVNSIAADAQMLIDMRSNSQDELLKVEAKILPLIQEAVDEENARWKSDRRVTVELKLVGDRPAGSQPKDHMIVQSAWLATLAIGQSPELTGASSTNANLPISLGVPAVTIGGGGNDGRNHSPDEWYDPTNGWLGPQKIFLTILGLAGVDGVTAPLLPQRK